MGVPSVKNMQIFIFSLLQKRKKKKEDSSIEWLIDFNFFFLFSFGGFDFFEDVIF